MVVLAKGWSKLQGQIDKDSSESKETPPVAPARPGPQPPQPRRLSESAPLRPGTVPRTAQPVQRTAPRAARVPVGSPPPRETWRVDPEQIRRFMEQLSGQPRQAGRGQPRPAPPPIAHPPVRKAEALAPPPPAPAKPEPVSAAPAPEPAMAGAPASSPSRAAQWAEALRDRQNIRNIIISAEIIGRPKVFQ